MGINKITMFSISDLLDSNCSLSISQYNHNHIIKVSPTYTAGTCVKQLFYNITYFLKAMSVLASNIGGSSYLMVCVICFLFRPATLCYVMHTGLCLAYSWSMGYHTIDSNMNDTHLKVP